MDLKLVKNLLLLFLILQVMEDEVAVGGGRGGHGAGHPQCTYCKRFGHAYLRLVLFTNWLP